MRALTTSSFLFLHFLGFFAELEERKCFAFVVKPSSPVLRPQQTLASRTVSHERCPDAPSHRSFRTPPTLQMVSYEDLMERLPSKSVIDAVEASKGGKVIASDVATSAGVSLSQARKDLTALASLSQGDIAVDTDGELIYSFPRNLNSVLAQKSAKFKALQTFRKVWPSLFWLVRVSFGVALLASLLAVFSTILFLSTSDNSSDRRRDDRGFGGRSLMMDPFWGVPDFFYYRPYGYYGVYGRERKDPDEMGFLESVFSYVFGDGNPNSNLEEKRLSLVANMIRQNKGVVTAEQLAPYCDDVPDPSEQQSSTYVDESFVLPTVLALNGEPSVTEEGDIYYAFPELQMSASDTKVVPSVSKEAMTLRRAGLKPKASNREIASLLNYNGIRTRGALERSDLIRLLEKALPPMTEEEEAELIDSDPSLLQEREWKFSAASGLNRFLAGGLGFVNLAGALFLGNMLGQYAMYGVRLPSYYGLVQSLYPFLLGYAVLFNVIPLVRNFWINRQNSQIRKRNKARRNWRIALASAARDSSIGRKILAATRMGTKTRKLGARDDDIIFDTKSTIEQVDLKKEKMSLEEFDRRLGGTDSFQ